MKVLFVITSFENGAWLSEITHPYWHLIERDVEVDFASPKGGKIGWSPYSDPYGQGTTEPHDLVSKGSLARYCFHFSSPDFRFWYASAGDSSIWEGGMTVAKISSLHSLFVR